MTSRPQRVSLSALGDPTTSQVIDSIRSFDPQEHAICHGSHSGWFKPRSTRGSHLVGPNPPGACTSGLGQNQDAYCTRRILAVAPWLSTSRCHLLHIYDQSQPGDAGASEQADRGEIAVSVDSWHFPFYLPAVSGQVWIFDWIAERFRDCGF